MRRLLQPRRTLIGLGLAGAAALLSISDVSGSQDTSPGIFENIRKVPNRVDTDSKSFSINKTSGATINPITPWDWNWDGKQFEGPNSQNATASGDATTGVTMHSRHLLLIRHGQYEFAQDDKDCHLTELGREQLAHTGRRLRQLNLPYERMVVSTMTRATESAEEIRKQLPRISAESCELIREGAPFPGEPPIPNWKPSEEEFRVDGQRIESAFKKYVHRAGARQKADTFELFVCHANVIRYFICRALQLPPEAWIRFSLDNGSITWLTIRPNGRVSLRWLGNSGHMPPEKLSLS